MERALGCIQRPLRKTVKPLNEGRQGRGASTRQPLQTQSIHRLCCCYMARWSRHCVRPALFYLAVISLAACNVSSVEIAIAFPPPETQLFCRLCGIDIQYHCDALPDSQCAIAVHVHGNLLASDPVSCEAHNHTAALDVTRLPSDLSHAEVIVRLSCSHLQSTAVAAVQYVLTPLPQTAPPSAHTNSALLLSRLPLADPLVAGVAATITSNLRFSFPIFRSARVAAIDCWAQLPQACSGSGSLSDCIAANRDGITLWLAFSNASLASPVVFDHHTSSIAIQTSLTQSQHAGASLNIIAAAPASALRFTRRSTPTEFFAQRKCSPALQAQVSADLNLWLGADLRLSRAEIDGGYASSWCARITVINGTVYSLDPKPHMQMTNGAEHWFYSMLSETLAHLYGIVALPDMDILVGGEVPELPHGAKLPILSMTKSTAHMNILYPDTMFLYWDGLRLPDHVWYRPPADYSRAHAVVPWHKRIPKLYWRGTVAGWKSNSRGRLVILGRLHPQLIDALPQRLVNEAWTERVAESEGGWTDFSDAMRRGTPGNASEVFSYRYVINTHGNGNDWSNRFRSLLSTGAVVFKQESSLFEFWEWGLKPWVHYVPVRRDLSDLPQLLRWAQQNDSEARRIAEAGVMYVQSSVRYDDALCYWSQLAAALPRTIDYAPVAPDPSQPYRITKAFEAQAR